MFGPKQHIACVPVLIHVGTGKVNSMWRWSAWEGESAWLAVGSSAVCAVRLTEVGVAHECIAVAAKIGMVNVTGMVSHRQGWSTSCYVNIKASLSFTFSFCVSVRGTTVTGIVE